MTKKTRIKKAGIKYCFNLYITGMTSISNKAITNLHKIFLEAFDGAYELRIIDIKKQPALAEQENILVTPTLTRVSPLPQKRLIGYFSETARVLRALDLD